VTVSLTDLAAGDSFEPTSFTITREMARAYRAATADAQDHAYAASRNAVPPLAVAALALGELLRRVGLPQGSLHAGESLEFHAAVPEGAILECRARLAQRSVRAGWIVSVLESDIYRDGAIAVSARATVLSPAPS
jgi:MaoC dehydratase-like protein